MTIVCIILSSLALAAAVTCMGVTIHERKRSRERNVALHGNVFETGRIAKERVEKLSALVSKAIQGQDDRIKAQEDALKTLEEQSTQTLGALKAEAESCVSRIAEGFRRVSEGQAERIKALEDGTVPDYEKAKAAAKAVDDFNQGLANILNYDPYETARLQREERAGGEGT